MARDKVRYVGEALAMVLAAPRVARDFDASLRFFTQALGFRVIDDNAPLWFLHCANSDHCSIVLCKMNLPTLNHIAFEMPETIANAVLFATSSFWQGVDVQGEQLSCVIIDRLPFAVPSDPVVAARVKAIDAGGGNAFFEYQLPSAVITLKQGFGRLIRSLHDRGLLALLDNRILKKAYGRVFVESLPPYSRTTDLRKVEEFFGADVE